jgi:hypothetical protein
MWRLRYVLLSLVLVPAPLLGQVQVSLLVPGDAMSLGAQIQALERSREALLEARQSVETALGDVERVLETLRRSASPCDQAALVRHQAPGGADSPPPARPASRSLRDLWSAVRSAIELRSRDLDRLQALALARIVRYQMPAETPLPLLPARDARDSGRPVVATARDLEVPGAPRLEVSPLLPAGLPSAGEPPACQPEAEPTRSMEEVGLERAQPVLAALEGDAPGPSSDPSAPRLPTVDGQEALSRPGDDESQP